MKAFISPWSILDLPLPPPERNTASCCLFTPFEYDGLPVKSGSALYNNDPIIVNRAAELSCPLPSWLPGPNRFLGFFFSFLCIERFWAIQTSLSLLKTFASFDCAFRSNNERHHDDDHCLFLLFVMFCTSPSSLKQSGIHTGNPWPPYKERTPLHPCYRGLIKLLHCKTLHIVIFTLLYKVTFAAHRWVANLHVVLISINLLLTCSNILMFSFYLLSFGLCTDQDYFIKPITTTLLHK